MAVLISSSTWSAYRLLIQGVDPYDPQQTLALQCSVGLHCQYPRITYTPPWLWLLMSPVLMQPFEIAVPLWTQVAVVLVIASATLVATTFRSGAAGMLLATGAALFALPLIIDLLFGQLSAVLMFGVACLFLGRVRQIAPLEGAALVVLSAKPHLFVPLGLGLAIMDLRNRRWQVLMWTVLLLLPLVGISEWLSPGAAREWLKHLLFPRTDLSVKAATEWATDAPAAALARSIASGLGSPPRWPLLAAPILGAVLAIGFSLRMSERADWKIAFPILLWLGFAFAPFVWFSDFATLGLMQAAAVAQLYVAGKRIQAVVILLIGVACNVAAQRLEMRGTPHFGLAEMFWFPVVPLGLWLLSLAMMRARTGRRDAQPDDVLNR